MEVGLKLNDLHIQSTCTGISINNSSLTDGFIHRQS